MTMLAPTKINELVNKAASAILKRPAGIQRVLSRPALDSEGHEALHITIVLKRGSADTLVEIDRALRDAREDRFPIIDFVTEEELESVGATES